MEMRVVRSKAMNVTAGKSFHDTAKDVPVDAGQLVVQSGSLEDCIADPGRQRLLLELLAAGDIPVFKGVAKESELEPVIRHLHGMMINTMEDYVPIREGARNYMRLSFGDERATVPLWAASWSFFSWNRDLFLLYRRYAAVYRLRNLLSGFPPDTFISRRVEHGCAARLCVHFYPSGKGLLGAHTDPLGRHQIATATLVMSKRGRGFASGGFYVKRQNDERLFVEDTLEPGDLYFCNPACVHGVEIVDASAEYDPMGRAGRWNMLFPVNKIAGNTEISDSINYETT
jgi:hypothetical protein